MPEPHEIAELLDEGLTLRWAGDHAAAVARWNRVIELVPGHPAAIDYIEAAGARAPAATDGEATRMDTRRLEQAVLAAARECRNDDAIELLYEAQGQHPRDPEVIRSIQLMKHQIGCQLLKSLGDLERVVEALPLAGLSSEEQIVMQVVEREGSLREVLSASPLGQLRTLRVLARHYPAPTASDPARLAALVEEGVEAILARDHASVYRIFTQALAVAPDDPMVRANLRRLEEMRRG